MNRNSPGLLALALLTSLGIATPAVASDADRWKTLGELHVRDRVDRDTLDVGAKKGKFDAIRLRLEGPAVEFHDLKIHFENGDVQDVRLRSVIPAGGHSRAIDLDGRQRAIDKIVFIYDAQTRRRGKGARVAVDGRMATAGQGPGTRGPRTSSGQPDGGGSADGWKTLGELHVSDRIDRDTLNVGAKKGRFDAIRLRLEGPAVEFHDLKIHFGNGDVQDVRLRSVIPAGGHSRAIDLDGRQRAIDKIVFIYDAQTRRRGKGARVAVDGRR